MEVKNIAREAMSKREEKELFSQFAEDYNTSTLPQSVARMRFVRAQLAPRLCRRSSSCFPVGAFMS